MSDIRSVWERTVMGDPALAPTVRITAWAIRHHVNRSGKATMGVNKLASLTGKSSRTVIRHLRALERAGYLERIPGAGAYGPNGRTTLTLLALPTEKSGGGDKSVTMPADGCHLANDQVSNRPSKSDNQGVTRTSKEPINKPAVDSMTLNHLDKSRGAESTNYIRQMVELFGRDGAVRRTHLTAVDVERVMGEDSRQEG